MSRYTRPYEGATMVRAVVYRVPEDAKTFPEVHGGRAVVRLYDGLASAGYKTGYERKPVRWIEAESFTPLGKRFQRQCWRYTGKRYDKADADFRKLCQDLQVVNGCILMATPPEHPARDLTRGVTA